MKKWGQCARHTASSYYMHCYRHPKVETFLRCQKCERPICTDCVRTSPVGARCPECVVVRDSPLYQVAADKMTLGALAGVAAGFVLGYLLVLLSSVGFFLLWAGLVGGGAMGEAVLRAIQRKRGTKIEVMTGVSTAAGVLLAFGVWYLARGGAPDPVAMMEALQRRPYFVLAAAVSVFSAVSRVRFF